VTRGKSRDGKREKKVCVYLMVKIGGGFEVGSCDVGSEVVGSMEDVMLVDVYQVGGCTQLYTNVRPRTGRLGGRFCEITILCLDSGPTVSGGDFHSWAQPSDLDV
jgi:hypothetical protein